MKQSNNKKKPGSHNEGILRNIEEIVDSIQHQGIHQIYYSVLN